MIEERRGEGRFWATVVFAIVMVVGIVARQATPKPADEGAPTDEFSAHRARALLTSILGDETPHPTGSIEADRVRQRIVDALAALGLAPTVEESLVCSESGSCALVRNVVAELPGRQVGPAVMLNAHYDSVAAGPGAADDGAGVGALLEVARVLKAGATPERTVRFLIDDAEEAGLLGGEAWVRRHGIDETLAVIVLEARGSSGPVLMFETSQMNLELAKSYARAVSDPATSSVFFSIYERLPNRTNFTVFKDRGYKGMALAFIEDPARYHTPLDDLQHLSDSSLQHMGDLTLSLARELAENGLAESLGNASYFDLLGATMVLWPESWNIWLAVVALVLVSLVGTIAIRVERATAPHVLMGWLVVLATVAVAGIIGWVCWRLAIPRTGESAWTANGDLLVLAAWLVAAASATIPFTFMKRPPSLFSIWTSVWLIQGVVGVALAKLLPGAAYLFFVPAMVAGLSGIVSLLRKGQSRIEGMVIVPFGVSLVLLVPILGGLYDGLGLVVLPGISALAALALSSLLVSSTEARRTAMFVVACLVGVIACVAGFYFLPVYSTNDPRALNVASVHEAMESRASVVLLGDTDPMPTAIAEGAAWTRERVGAFRRNFGGDAPRLWSSSVAAGEPAFPDLSETTAVDADSGRLIRLVAKPFETDSLLRVLLPDGARVREVRYGGSAFRFESGSPGCLLLRGVPPAGAVVTMWAGRGSGLEVMEERPGLSPEAERIASLRSESEVPIGPGDRSIFVTRLLVDDIPRAGSPDETRSETSP